MTVAPRGIRLVAIAAIAVLAAPAACGVNDDEADDVAACDVLLRDAPGGGDGPDDASPTVGQTLGDALVLGDRNRVIVYVDPGEDDRLDDLEAEIADRPGVEGTQAADVDATYADFQDLFEGEDVILDDMRPQDLPTSVTALTDSTEAAEELASWARTRPGVYDVRTADDRSAAAGTLGDTMVAEADRTAWLALAEDLDRIVDGPAWASRSADLIRATLEGGDGASPRITAGRRQAHDDLVAVRRACRADG